MTFKLSLFQRWLAMLSLIVGISLGANAESVNIDGLYYELNSPKTGEATLTYQNTTTSNYSSLPASVAIPEKVTYNGTEYTVTTIADSAFANCTSLESISIPGSVTSIGTVRYHSYAYLPFYNCTSLKSIRFEDGDATLSLGSSWDSIGKGLFYYSPLEEVYLGRNVQYKEYKEYSSYPFINYPERYGYSAFYNQSKLTKVTIGPEVESLPNYLFYKCAAIKDISFGESLTSIGSHAFDGCTSLTSAMLPNSVTYIDSYSFYNCTSIQSVSLGNATTIGDYAFSYAGIRDIIIPSSVNKIGNNTFEYSKLQSVRFGDGVISIGSACFANSSLQNVVIGDKLTEIPASCFEGCTYLSDIHIGSNVTTIADRAFANCTSLESISIPGSVTSIGDYGFCNTPNLKDVSLPTTLNSIGHYAFSRSGIRDIIIPSSVNKIGNNTFEYSKLQSVRFGDGEMSIGGDCFANSSLQNVVIGDKLTRITSGCFDGCTYLSDIHIGSNVKTIGDRAFANCTSLESISIPGSVTSIGITWSYSSISGDYNYCGGAGKGLPFYGCTSLKSIRFEDGDATLSLGSAYSKEYSDYSKGLFYYSPLEEVYIGRNITYAEYSYGSSFADSPEYYGYSAFYNQPKLTKVTISETVTDIPAYLFYNNASITLMTLPNVNNIGEAAFKQCSKLTTLNLGQNLVNVGNEAFYGCTNFTELILPNTFTTMGESAFEGCTKLTVAKLGTSLTAVPDKAFKGCTNLTELILPDTFTTMGKSAFEGCTNLTELILPDTFTTMGESAFEGCTKLTVAKLGTSLTAVPDKAFKDCTSLSEIVIPASAQSLGNQALYNASGLATITLNEGLKTIGDEVFWNNSGVMQFSIPGTVTSMGTNCFYGCTSATYLTFRDGDETLKINNSGTRSSVIDAKTTNSSLCNRLYDYFYDCPIRFLTLGRNITYDFYDDVIMYDLDGTSIKIVSRASAPFVNSQELSSVTIGPKVTFLYHHLFDGCTGITSISLPETLQSINGYAFRNCSKLSEIVVPKGVTTIGEHCFDQCLSLKNLRFDDGTSTITLSTVVSMFGDSPLENMYVGRNIDYTLIEGKEKEAPFYNRSTLTNVTISDKGGVTYLKPYFIYGASTLPGINVPDNVLEIGMYAFAECSSLEEAVLSKNLSLIDEGLFDQDIALKSLIIPGAVNAVNQYALRGCGALQDLRFEDSTNPLTAAIARSGMGMCGDTHLENLYIGRNIRYSAADSDGYSPFYNLTSLKNVTFSNAGMVTECNDYLLAGCSTVENLSLPESLVTIGNHTFSDMTTLQYCRMFDNVESVGEYGFAGDVNLTDLTFSKKVKTLRNNLFMNCTSLPLFTVHPAVTSIEDNAFMNCNSLATLSFTDSNDQLNIGRRNENGNFAAMFSDSPVQSLYLSRQLIYNIDEESYAPFYNRSTLTDLRFGETLGDIGKFLFEKCSSIATVNIPGVESIGEKAFYDCTALSGLTLNSGTTSLGEHAFANCTALKNVVLPPTVVSVSDGCFMNDHELVTLDLGNSLEIIGPSAFSGCASLSELNFPMTLYDLGVESFKGCENLSYVTIPDGCSLSSIGACAFQNCTGIEWISLSNSITSLGDNSFDGCNSIRYIKSFNTVPPVGLPNFSENVIENSTVFVPAESLDDYKDADLWREFFNIRPISDGVFVTYLNLDKTEASMKASETLQLVAEAGPSTATDTSVGFSSDNMDIATVDSEGVITAVAVGEANIKAFAKDGSGLYKICKITVVPTLMGSIELDNSSLTLRANREAKLTAQIFPVTTTNKEIIWSSSNSSVATVDSEGNIVTKYKGNATIKATAADGSGVMASCELTVLPPLAGDSNDNDAVTITDAVNTANYAVGNPVENFCFEAADVNGDNRVTVADASATIGIILEQEAETSSRAMVRSIARAMDVDKDALVIDDYKAKSGETASLSVTLDNSIEYVAMQADIVVPEGMTLVDVKIGNRVAAYHSLVTRRIDERSMRIALFDLDNNAFADNDEGVLELVVKVNSATNENVEIFNILASDAQANEYVLTSTGGHNNEISGIEGTSIGNIRIETSANAINVYNAEGYEVAIYTIDGTTLSRFTAVSDMESRDVVDGVYVVAAGNKVEKVIVK